MARTHPYLTKSDFMQGTDCVKRLWQNLYKPENAAPDGEDARERMEIGKEIGELARHLHPTGVLIPYDEDADQAALRTQEYIAKGHPILFEATFIAGGLLARVDILRRSPNGWIIDEVKSSSLRDPADLVKSGKALDLAFQVFVTQQAGVVIESAGLLLVDTTYVHDGGPYDPHRLFGRADMTEACQNLVPEIASRAAEFLGIIGQDTAPEIETNTFCSGCPFYAPCHENAPAYDVVELPLIRREAVNQLRAQGYRTILDIPGDYPLKGNMARVRDVIQTQTPYISNRLAEVLEVIPYPAAFIDFESCNPPLPVLIGSRPNAQTCFQWSAHIRRQKGQEPEHQEFLHPNTSDPRAEFCQTLWNAIKDCESVFHYSSFEKTQLKSLVNDGIPYAKELAEQIEIKGIDLEKIIKEHIYLEAFRGRSSIKVVLPALVPSMSYDDLPINNGGAASAAFRRMVNPATSESERIAIQEALLIYCRHDTLAMVKIFDRLWEYGRQA